MNEKEIDLKIQMILSDLRVLEKDIKFSILDARENNDNLLVSRLINRIIRLQKLIRMLDDV